MKCNHCGNIMETSKTTFSVVKDEAVYVVKNVPCLECPNCGDISYSQDTAKELDRYVSGRVIPAKQSKAWIFQWGDPVVEIPQNEVSTTTASPTIGVMTTLGLS